MSQYKVTVKEVWVQSYMVDASNREEALSKVHDGDCEPDEDSFEYSHAQEDCTWDVVEPE